MSKNSIFIREVGPREGFQVYPEFVPTEKKFELIKALSKTGLREIEVTSFVNPQKVPAHKDADQLCKLIEQEIEAGNLDDSVSYTGLYLNPKGYERAWQYPLLHTEAYLHLSPDEDFLKSNMNTTIEELTSPEQLERWGDVMGDDFISSVTISCAFSKEVEEYYDQLLSHVILPELDIFYDVTLADTTGIATPEQIERSVEYIIKRYKKTRVGLHLHAGDNNLVIENVLAGLQCGVRRYDSSILGVGGCPFSTNIRGNVATEQLLEICQRNGLETGVDTDKYNEAIEVAKSIFYLV